MSRRNRITLAKVAAMKPKDEARAPAQELAPAPTDGQEASITQTTGQPLEGQAGATLDELSNSNTTAEGMKEEAVAPKQEAPKPQPKPQTKKSRVYDMCAAKGGTTIDQIAAALGIGKVAARSLIGDLRRDKNVIKQDKGVYTVG